MTVAEVLAKASPRKVIHIQDDSKKCYFIGMVKDCPVELYNLKVYDVAGCYVRVIPEKSNYDDELADIEYSLYGYESEFSNGI